MRSISLRNHQRARSINSPVIRLLTRYLLDTILGLRSYELRIHFIACKNMAAMNQRYLQHEGSTDVITFDYQEGYPEMSADQKRELWGEVFISVEDAVRQGLEFETTWKDELVRYIIHGVLHLRGYDDVTPGKRKIMKKKEDQLLRELSNAFDLRKVGR
jgi:probable rRNA maturation factor